MKRLEGTETAVNLMRAFAGESQARNRYYMAAGVAEKEGYHQIKEIFLETSDNERAHAKVFYDLICEGFQGQLPVNINIDAGYPVASGMIKDHLQAGVSGEHGEWAEIYPAFADVAQREGFPEVANAFKMIANIEKHHKERFSALLKNVEVGKVFKKDNKVQWICANCGHIHEGTDAPTVCPVCRHPQGFFNILSESF
ncbi:MAG: rubrerythrin family protein [Clostridia bacterium]|nr:rubrerythrin family protein [Clostridia bacterium]